MLSRSCVGRIRHATLAIPRVRMTFADPDTSSFGRFEGFERFEGFGLCVMLCGVALCGVVWCCVVCGEVAGGR